MSTPVKYKVEVKNKGGSEFYVKSEHAEFTVDSDGGKGPAPLETLLAALGSCTGHYIRNFLTKANIDYAFFTVSVDSDLVKDKGFYLKDINISIDLNGAVIDDLKKESLIEFVKNCAVHNTLKASPNISLRIL